MLFGQVQPDTFGRGARRLNSRSGNEQILDGVLDPLLIDFAWYAGNNISMEQMVSRKWDSCNPMVLVCTTCMEVHGSGPKIYGCVYPESDVDPYCSTGTGNVLKGGYYDSSPIYLTATDRYYLYNTIVLFEGIRLALTE